MIKLPDDEVQDTALILAFPSPHIKKYFVHIAIECDAEGVLSYIVDGLTDDTTGHNTLRSSLRDILQMTESLNG